MSPTSFSNFSSSFGSGFASNIASGTNFGNFTLNPSFNLSPALLAALAAAAAATGGTGGATTAPPATGALSPTSPFDLRLTLATIPIAQEGHIITPEYHNSLRDALLLLADLIGATPGAAEANLAFPPAFYPVFDDNAQMPVWQLRSGIASRPVDGQAQGWMPVQLPNGWKIMSMKMTGKRSGAVTTCAIRLVRQKLTEPVQDELISVSLRDTNGDPFTTPATPIKGSSPAVIQDLSLVDNDQYHYLLQANLTGASEGAVVDLYSFQITCRQF